MDDPTAFHRELDQAILEGDSAVSIADRFGIRERSVRRRKSSLMAQGHHVRPQGTKPGLNNDSNYRQ